MITERMSVETNKHVNIAQKNIASNTATSRSKRIVIIARRVKRITLNDTLNARLKRKIELEQRRHYATNSCCTSRARRHQSRMFSSFSCQLSSLRWRLSKKRERSWHQRRKEVDQRVRQSSKSKMKSIVKLQQWKECWERKKYQQSSQSRTSLIKRRWWSERRTSSRRNRMIKRWEKSLIHRRSRRRRAREE